MIAPNAPEIRPGMGYAPGARSLGYVAHLGYTPGAFFGYTPGAARTMGDYGSISSTMISVAEDDGIADADLQLLGSVGATDADIENLVNGNITLTALYAQYGVTIPPASTATANTTPQSTGHVANAGQIPSGSTLLYTCTVNTPPLTSAQNIIDAITSHLPSHGMSLVSSQVSQSGTIAGAASFSITVLDSVGNTLVSDAKSVLDGIVENYLGPGNLQLQSSVTVVSPGITATGLPAPNPATSLATWLENNAMWIGVGLLGLVLANNLTGGKRR